MRPARLGVSIRSFVRTAFCCLPFFACRTLEQHVLSPGHTLEDAKLVDGQLVLLEISQQDGAWPRSQMQSMFEAEEEEAQAGTAVRGCSNATCVFCVVEMVEPRLSWGWIWRGWW